MRVRVLLFAGLREAVGKKEFFLELKDDSSLKELLAEIQEEIPVLDRYRGRLVVAVNQRRSPEETLLQEGDEVALLPPISGGSERTWLQAEPLSLDALYAEVRSPDRGGLVSFLGVVRNHSRGSQIDHLEYEAYAPMAELEMRNIAREITERWPEVRIAMSHRVGRLEVGDPAVMIVAAAPHRAEAFEACRFAIDTLKETVPIWKKEFGEDGATWVEDIP